MTSGVVFDIQRFGLHDGPGIRTTVFLKGCPLRCLWCHNPESQLRKPQYSFDYNQCRRCLEEGHACPNGVSLADGAIHHERHLIDPSTFDLCPYEAVKVVGQSADVGSVLDEVAQDLPYYRRSGGGLTISGGEPMAQFDFSLALAREAKARGIHVCLDTCGQAPTEQYLQIAPHVDLFLFDYKATGAETHRRLTRVWNDLILTNLEALYQAGAAIVLRCPLVPRVNDSEEHLQGIAALAARYPKLVGVEIMAYHDMGNHKALRVGQEAPLAGLKTVSDQVKHDWLERLHQLGCTQATLG